jgi:hypothetical protein
MKTLILAFLSLRAFAFHGDVSFTPDEVRAHQQALPTIMATASKCLQDDLDRHHQFIQKYGISAFYGENAAFAKVTTTDGAGNEVKRDTTSEEKRDMLRQRGFPESLVQQFVPSGSCPNGRASCPLRLEVTSCIGLALKCLQQGFSAVGHDAMWARLRAFTRANDVTGNSLQYGLQKLGWKTVYWNPDTSAAARWDAAEQAAYPGNPKGIWGKHVQTLASVMNEQMYGGLHVDDATSAVNFGRNGPPEISKKVPFFVGIAHQGYHVFPGMYGQIIEGHSTRSIDDANTLQTSPFNPLVQGGGPRGGPYKSGLIAIPPGY